MREWFNILNIKGYINASEKLASNISVGHGHNLSELNSTDASIAALTESPLKKMGKLQITSEFGIFCNALTMLIVRELAFQKLKKTFGFRWFQNPVFTVFRNVE